MCNLMIARRRVILGLGASLCVPAIQPAATTRHSVLNFDPRSIRPTPLTPTQMGYAQTAWAYFNNTTNTQTGLVPSTFYFESMTMWDQGSYFYAIISAARLGIITPAEAENRLQHAFVSLARLPLYVGRFPNKAYDIKTLEMTDYANKPTTQGIGYSALDIMRLSGSILVAVRYFPRLNAVSAPILQRWQITNLHDKGRLSGRSHQASRNHQASATEGRIGYEQYSARVGLKLGMPVQDAARYDLILRWQRYFDIFLPGDQRTAQTDGISSLTTSEPFLLDALEFGWQEQAIPIAMAVLDAQMYRYAKTGILTSLSEDHIKGPPYFAYHAILDDFAPFVSVTAKRRDVSDKRCLSTKASFGWWALTANPYCETLLRAIDDLQSENGWYAGRFEADNSVNRILTLNSNAVILEALQYRAFGPLLAL